MFLTPEVLVLVEGQEVPHANTIDYMAPEKLD